MEWQKTEPMRFAVFEKMWVIVIWDTHYMETKKQCPESVLWTILKHYWNKFQKCKNDASSRHKFNDSCNKCLKRWVDTCAIFLIFVRKCKKMKIDYVHCLMRRFWRTLLRSFGQNNMGISGFPTEKTIISLFSQKYQLSAREQLKKPSHCCIQFAACVVAH